jgi:hypothetical protein
MKSIIIFSLLFATSNVVPAQQLTAFHSIDSIIQKAILDPEIKKAYDNQRVPDWAAMQMNIAQKFDTISADRNVLRNKIFYYYGKDKPQFCAAIVSYTEKYEDNSDSQLMNKNANFILQYSTDKKEITTAVRWIQYAQRRDPSNAEYKKTLEALETKLKTL